jgi:amidase
MQEELVPIWKEAATQKREAVNALIPSHWRLACSLPSATEQKNITGEYIQNFLSPREIEITETDAYEIVVKTTTGIWKAREVVEAFCHRAALAHQMVSLKNSSHDIVRLLIVNRSTAFTR